VDELAPGSAATGAPTAGSPAAGPPVLRSAPPRDLGVGAMRVDAADESPPRAGLLLTAVNRGSAAQKSGLLVGDILYEADGHAIQSLSDLQAALAASRSKSALTLKLYRGTDKLTVTAQF
jgi:S1-C subfamily serine protease